MPETDVPAHGSSVPAHGSSETYNPWSIVHLVFDHLVSEGLHPVLGEPGDPHPAAAELLKMLGIEPAAEGNRQVTQDIREHLQTLRTTVLGQR